jgi:aminoglycoside phosphotransferase (APT) family kinase protein
VKPISQAALKWLCRELAPGGRVVRVRPMRGGVSRSVHAVWLETAGGARRGVVVRRYGEDWNDDQGVCGREFKLLEARVWDVVHAMWPAIAYEQRVVHGDFWPGNTVWHSDRLSGVIDWETAALGSASRDVATCRLDLANLFDLETADAFTCCYETAMGARVANLPFWDLLVATGALRYIENWARGYRDLGRTDLSGELARARVEQFARAALPDAQD